MEDYLEEKPIEAERLKADIRKATLDISMTPVLCGSAFKNKGVQPLLDAVIDYLPSPLDVPPVEGLEPEKAATASRRRRATPPTTSPSRRSRSRSCPTPSSASSPTSASTRASSSAGGRVLNSTTGRTERVGRILMMHANHREEQEEVYAGDIAAGVGLKQTSTGDTLCAPTRRSCSRRSPSRTRSCTSRSSRRPRPTRRSCRVALQRLGEEDPTFQVRTDEETGQTVISGMGELHLEVIVDRLKREFNVEAAVGRPQVAYRETVRETAEKVEGKFIRQTGGSGQYGVVYIDLEPAPGEGFDFVNKIKGGSVPSEFIPAVEKGIEEALESGVKAGYPMVDVRATLTDGKYHDTDSSEIAFKIAGSLALRKPPSAPSPCCSSPSWPWRWSRLRSSSAT